MDAGPRRLLYRIEMRIAQECGRELAVRPLSADPAVNAWGAGLVRAWKQVRKLRETGHVVNLDNDDDTTMRATE